MMTRFPTCCRPCPFLPPARPRLFADRLPCGAHWRSERLATHVSGAKTDRAQLRRVIEALEPSDVLMVTRLDRLARSTRDLLSTLAASPARRPDSAR